MNSSHHSSAAFLAAVLAALVFVSPIPASPPSPGAQELIAQYEAREVQFDGDGPLIGRISQSADLVSASAGRQWVIARFREDPHGPARFIAGSLKLAPMESADEVVPFVVERLQAAEEARSENLAVADEFERGMSAPLLDQHIYEAAHLALRFGFRSHAAGEALWDEFEASLLRTPFRQEDRRADPQNTSIPTAQLSGYLALASFWSLGPSEFMARADALRVEWADQDAERARLDGAVLQAARDLAGGRGPIPAELRENGDLAAMHSNPGFERAVAFAADRLESPDSATRATALRLFRSLSGSGTMDSERRFHLLAIGRDKATSLEADFDEEPTAESIADAFTRMYEHMERDEEMRAWVE